MNSHLWPVAKVLGPMLVAAGIAWGTATARIDGLEERVQRIDERVEKIYYHLIQGPPAP